MKNSAIKNHIPHEAPGPKGCPFVGSLPALSLNILTFFEKITAKYGTITLFKLGRKKVYLISHPRDLAKLYTDERKGHYDRKFFHEAYKPAFGNGIFNSYGSDWKLQRALLQPYFQKKEIAKWFPLMQEETQQFINHLTSTNTQNTLQVEKAVLPLVQSIMCRILFGRSLQDEDSRLAVDAINKVSQQTFIRSLFAFMFNGVLNRLPTPGNLKYQKALRTIDQSIQNLHQKVEETGDQQSIIAKLALNFEQQELRDHLFTLFFGGQETTVNAIAFTLFYLGKNPKIQQQARDEINTILAERGSLHYADLKQLSTIENVIAESLRLSPPVYASYRDVIGDQQLSDTLIRDQSILVFSPYLTHREKNFWRDHERFNPDRFKDNATIEKFAFMPYGGGMHTCLGIHLAQVEIMTVVSLVLSRFRWTVPDGFLPQFKTYMTLRAKKGIYLNLKPI